LTTPPGVLLGDGKMAIDNRVNARSVKLLLDDDVPVSVFNNMPKWLRDADQDSLEHLHAALARAEKAESVIREFKELCDQHASDRINDLIEKHGVKL
jgi:hypothetical protein